MDKKPPKRTEPNDLELCECWAYGLGWSEDKFWNSSIEFFFKSIIGFELISEVKERQEWERIRLLGFWILSPYNKGLTVKKVIEYPWDEVVKTKKEFFKGLETAFDKLENG